jgi:ferredoxin
MPIVRFITPEGEIKEVEVEVGAKITQAAYKAGILIPQSCGGAPSCTDCTVLILKEEIPNGSLEKMLGPEERLLGNVYYLTKERLACQAIIKASVEIKIPPAPPKKTK